MRKNSFVNAPIFRQRFSAVLQPWWKALLKQYQYQPIQLVLVNPRAHGIFFTCVSNFQLLSHRLETWNADLILLTLTYVSALSLLHYSYLNIGIDHKSTAVKSGSLFPVRRPSLVSFSPLPFCVLSWFVFIAKLWLWVTWGWYEWANTPSRRVI